MLVSICIPAYEYPELLKTCLLSIVNQTYQNFEVIITDDSSHDELAKIVKDINDDRIHYYKNPLALGSPANWNKCISVATGDLIKILHHDDRFYNDYSLAEFVQPFIINPDLKFAFSQCVNIYPDKEVPYKISEHVIKKIIEHPTLLLLFNGIGAPSTTIFKKQVYNEFKFDEKSKWFVDVVFYINVLNKFNYVHTIKKALIKVTAQSNTQVTNNTSGLVKVEEAIYAFDKFGILKKEKLSSLEFLYFTELFKRYHIKSNFFLEHLNYPLRKFTEARLSI